MRIALALLVVAASALAQEAARPRHNASYVPDDNETVRALVTKAIDAAQDGRPEDAADLLSTLLLGKQRGLVSIRGRELFTSQQRWATLQLLSERAPFTTDVLVAWRATYDRSANAALASAIEVGDARRVLLLVARYPAATGAPGALLALVDRALQRGDREAARTYLMRAQEHVPRSAKAAWLASPAYSARQKHLATLPRRRPSNWPTLGGDATRARNGDPVPDVARFAQAWDAELLNDPEPLPTFELQNNSTSREHSPILPFYPVFDDDHVYVHLGPKVAVLSRRTGKVLYYAPGGDGVNARHVDDMIAKSPGVRAATIANGILYFNQLLHRGSTLQRHNALVAFDTKTKTVLWEIRQGAGPKPDALRKRLFFRGAPAVVHGKLYVYAAVREESEGRPSRKEEAHLYCLSAGTGTLLWHRFLGYGDTEAAPEMPPQSGLAPAVANGVVVAVTGLGVAAALDADSGDTLWLLRYDRKPVRERDRLTENQDRQVHLGSAWFREPPRIVGDMVFFAPIDSDQRYGCWLRGDQDATDGEFYLQQWAVARNANPGRNSLLEQVAGISGNRIYFVGRRDERAGVIETYQTVVSNPLRRGDDSFAYARVPAVERDARTGRRVPPEVYGRCTIAGNALLVPTRHVLFSFDVGKPPRARMASSERFQEIPPLAPFVPPAGRRVAGRAPRPHFGTLVALGGRLYAMTSQRLICYAQPK